jgi:sugar phosphate isomerase/epimerase
MEISIQLYTLRDLTSKDFAGVMKQLAGFGYRFVELAGYGNLGTAAAVRKACDEAGVAISAAHEPLERLADDSLHRVLDEHQNLLRNSHIVCPWIGEEWRNKEGYLRLAERLNVAGEQAARRGMTLSYHNHAFEFQRYDGELGLDLLWQHTDAKFLRSQLDVYWVKAGGVDPVSYMRQWADRIHLLHLKDMDRANPGRFATVGQGTLDFPAIVRQARALNVPFGAVEKDDCYGESPLVVAQQALDYLRGVMSQP